MKIKLNGKPHDTMALTLLALCLELGHDPQAKIATAVNGDFVPLGARKTCVLSEQDEVEIVAPRQGG